MWSLDRLQPVCTFPLPSGMRAVADVQWQPHAPDILAIVYAPATVVLWNTTTIIKIRGWPHTKVERVPRLTNLCRVASILRSLPSRTCGPASSTATSTSWHLTHSTAPTAAP